MQGGYYYFINRLSEKPTGYNKIRNSTHKDIDLAIYLDYYNHTKNWGISTGVLRGGGGFSYRYETKNFLSKGNSGHASWSSLIRFPLLYVKKIKSHNLFPIYADLSFHDPSGEDGNELLGYRITFDSYLSGGVIHTRYYDKYLRNPDISTYFYEGGTNSSYLNSSSVSSLSLDSLIAQNDFRGYYTLQYVTSRSNMGLYGSYNLVFKRKNKERFGLSIYYILGFSDLSRTKLYFFDYGKVYQYTTRDRGSAIGFNFNYYLKVYQTKKYRHWVERMKN